MSGSAIGRFTNTSDYEEGLHELGAAITPTQPGPFTASLVRVDLPQLRLMRAKESGPRIGFFSIPDHWRYTIFLTRPGPPLVWNGDALSFGDVMLSGAGERLHQRTIEAAEIGIIGMPGQMLRRYARGLVGRTLAPLHEASIVRLKKAQNRHLLLLHARIGRLAETRPGTICHPEAARAIEQELIEALVTCIVTGDARGASAIGQGTGRTLARFEALLAQNADWSLSTTGMSKALGVPAQVLRSCCAASFGMSPSHYARLRRADRRSRSGRQ